MIIILREWMQIVEHENEQSEVGLDGNGHIFVGVYQHSRDGNCVKYVEKRMDSDPGHRQLFPLRV